MRKAITITATDRWPYLDRLLDDLLLNDLSGWHIYIQCEPNGSQSNSYAAGKLNRMAEKHGLAGVHVGINDQRLGVKDNPFNLLSRVFGEGADYVLYLEEDLSVSADVTLLADWYADARNGGLWSHSPPVIVGVKPGAADVCCRLFHPAGSDHSDDTAGTLFATVSFSSLGFILDRQQWATHFEPNWHNGATGWDWAVQRTIDEARGDLFCLCPVQGRSNHTGRDGGTHCPPELHDSRYSHLEPYWGPSIKYFDITTFSNERTNL